MAGFLCASLIRTIPSRAGKSTNNVRNTWNVRNRKPRIRTREAGICGQDQTPRGHGRPHPAGWRSPGTTTRRRNRQEPVGEIDSGPELTEPAKVRISIAGRLLTAIQFVRSSDSSFDSDLLARLTHDCHDLLSDLIVTQDVIHVNRKTR